MNCLKRSDGTWVSRVTVETTFQSALAYAFKILLCEVLSLLVDMSDGKSDSRNAFKQSYSNELNASRDLILRGVPLIRWSYYWKWETKPKYSQNKNNSFEICLICTFTIFYKMYAFISIIVVNSNIPWYPFVIWLITIPQYICDLRAIFKWH